MFQLVPRIQITFLAELKRALADLPMGDSVCALFAAITGDRGAVCAASAMHPPQS